jgi:2-(1,2-epoxy-1,2-dihydrophenyl)acetyl-CoA isomerase
MLLSIKKEDKVLYIKLNRPEVFNSFNREMSLDLLETLNKYENEDSVRVIVITGEGKAFCAGQDLGEAVADNGLTLEQIIEEHYNPIIRKIREIEKPVIVGVNGVAAGAGANIALAGDIVVANESASFIQAFSKIGLIPDSGGTFTLPRLVGMQLASALMMTGDKVSAEEALKYQMIYKVFKDDDFEIELAKLAAKISEMPTKALVLTKIALNNSLTNSLNQQLELEKELQVKAANSYDFKEGVSSFLEKRKPEFKGC